MGARFEALTEGVLMAPLDPRYTQVGFNSTSVQVCDVIVTILEFWFISILDNVIVTK